MEAPLKILRKAIPMPTLNTTATAWEVNLKTSVELYTIWEMTGVLKQLETIDENLFDVITLAAVVSFGAWAGFAFAMTGVLLASAVGYYAGRAFGRQTVRRLAGPRLNRLTQVLQQRGVIAITAVRLVPIAPFIVESMVAGAIHMKLWQLSVGTFLGMLPGTLMATVLGDAIESALHDPSRINWWFVGAVAAVLATATYIVQRWLRKVAIEPHHDLVHPAQQDKAQELRFPGRA